MTPKEEARKMHDKYYFEIWNNVSFDDESEVYESAKRCALICVNEMESFYIDIMRIGSRKRKEIYYFNEIRNEIEKL